MANSKIIYYGEILIDLTPDTIIDKKLLSGYTAHDASGENIVGTMANNGEVLGQINGLSTTSFTIPEGYASGGKVELDGSIVAYLKTI